MVTEQQKINSDLVFKSAMMVFELQFYQQPFQ